MGSACTLGGLQWIQLTQDRGRCRAAVNAVMNILVLVPAMELAIYLVYGLENVLFPCECVQIRNNFLSFISVYSSSPLVII
jgi:hypothetical protein